MKINFTEMFFKTMVRLFGARSFSQMYLASSQSKAYSKFCEKVYGRDLCQANMLDEEQLQFLLSNLNLNSSHKVLDIGCGIGKISEYISDKTGAKIVGVDFAHGAILAAQDRTREKLERVQFVTGNLNNLKATVREKFDAIVLIDSLYFVSDMPGCINTLKSLLNPKGVLAIFYSSTKNASDTSIDLLPENKPVGKALTAAGFIFKANDFTENENKIWNQGLLVANELKDEFIHENNLGIYKGRVAEAKRNLTKKTQESVSRYLYLATAE